MKSECRGGEVITGHSSNSEQQQGPESSPQDELPVGPPVTTRIPLLSQHSFSIPMLQVSTFSKMIESPHYSLSCCCMICFIIREPY